VVRTSTLPARRPTRTVGRGPYGSYVTTVAGVRALTTSMVRITLVAPELADFPASAPDQWVKLFLPCAGQTVPVVPAGPDWYAEYLALPPGEQPVMRTYTVRRHDPLTASVDIDVALHGDAGPGSAWARRARPGDVVGMFGPGAAYQPPPDASWRLLAGDQTALPALAAILEQDASGSTIAIAELDDAGEALALEHVRDQVTCVVRPRGAPRGASLVAAMRSTRLPMGRPYAWLAGEASLVRAARRHLVSERGLPRDAVCFLGYWRDGRTEDDR
jgi:NADPH-dependent ferric siderophore reductase